MRFRSKIDSWLAVVMGGTAALVVLALASTVATMGLAGLMVAVLALLVTVLPIVWMLTSTYYEVQDGTLRVVCGPLRKTIALADIESVSDSRSLISSPALSLDRLKIRYSGNRWVLVSPKDKQGFRKALGQDKSSGG